MESLSSLLWLLPLLLIAVIIALKSIERLLLLTTFLVPLSIQLRNIFPGSSADLFLPTEIILAALLFVVLFRLAGNFRDNLPILRNPLTVAILLILGWGFVTALTGQLPLVSLKAMAAKCWFVAGFYLLPLMIFRSGEKPYKLLAAYVAGMVIPSVLFLIKMGDAGFFSQSASYGASQPFFSDHTSFGAAVAFCIPIVFVWLADKGLRVKTRIAAAALLFLLLGALLFSYSRAAWISIAAAVLMAIILKLRVSFSRLVLAGAGVILLTVFSWSYFGERLAANRTDSSTNLTEHVRSVSNITTDASNLERINRWKSGLRMAADRPLLGFGPGSYQFLYAPYQKPGDKTIISTDFGEGGNIHSDYLGALTDSGVPGAVLWLALVLLFLSSGMRAVSSSAGATRLFYAGVVVSMTTYLVHSSLNSFLDTDKISAPFWLLMAVVASFSRDAGRGSEEVGNNN